MENKSELTLDLEAKIIKLAGLLAGVGCEGAENYLRSVVVPMAIESGKSIQEVINTADIENSEEGPHLSELYFALRKIKKADLEFLK